mgnify:FL=1
MERAVQTLSIIVRSPMNLVWAGLKQWIHWQFPRVATISVAELADWLNQEGSHPLLLDTRPEVEFAVSHLPGAQRIDPQTQEFDRFQALPHDTPIVTYCSVGYRSARVADRLQTAGFTRVRNLEGSIFEWANTDHPVYQGDRRVHQVHPYDKLWGLLLNPDLHPTYPSTEG